MTLRQHLIHRLGVAAFEIAFIACAMISFSSGVGVMIGLGVGAVVSAVRDHRRDEKKLAESVAKTVRKFGIGRSRVVVEEERSS